MLNVGTLLIEVSNNNPTYDNNKPVPATLAMSEC